MSKLNTLLKSLSILEKYIDSDSVYNISSYEDETQIVVNLEGNPVSDEDDELLNEIGTTYNGGLDLWFIG